MPVESSRGLGQGAAQVFDTSGLANQFAQQEDAKAKAKYVQQKDLEKKIAEVSGGLNDVFKEKIFSTRDREAIQGLYDGALKKMEGKWHLAADPRTPESREWNKLKQDVYMATAQSYETKQLLDEANKNIDDYTPETKQYLMEVYNNPLTVLDPTKLKKINTFDPDKWFQTEVQSPFFNEVEKQNQKDIGFNDKGDYVVTGTKTTATDEQIDKRVEVMLQNIYSDDKKLERFIDKYSPELEGLNRNEQLDKLPDLINRDYRGRLKYNKSDYNYNQKSGSGQEEPFNPNNIVTDIKLKTGTGNMIAIKGWEGWEGIKGYGNAEEIITPTNMYQTNAFKAVVPVTNKSIDATTGKPTKDMGTISVTYGSPAVYYFDKEGKVTNDTKNGTPVVMVHGMVDKGGIEGGALNILTPIDELTTVIQKTGLSVNEVKQGLLGSLNKGTTTNKSTTKSSKTGGAY